MLADDGKRALPLSDEIEFSDMEEAIDAPERVAPVIEFRDVCLAFDEKVILDGISFSVRRGETKIILGRSGGGKSTIIRLILGLIKLRCRSNPDRWRRHHRLRRTRTDAGAAKDRNGLSGRSSVRFTARL